MPDNTGLHQGVSVLLVSSIAPLKSAVTTPSGNLAVSRMRIPIGMCIFCQKNTMTRLADLLTMTLFSLRGCECATHPSLAPSLCILVQPVTDSVSREGNSSYWGPRASCWTHLHIQLAFNKRMRPNKYREMCHAKGNLIFG